QSYEIRMLDNRKLGELPELTGKLVKVHCISTEFTMRKHGGEKGVPFRIQIDTFKENENGEYTEHLHSASCQIKVFKQFIKAKSRNFSIQRDNWFVYYSTESLFSCQTNGSPNHQPEPPAPIVDVSSGLTPIQVL
ncbi:hypothetical protein AB205_0198720, partial [Aquarana catesbeiana]